MFVPPTLSSLLALNPQFQERSSRGSVLILIFLVEIATEEAWGSNDIYDEIVIDQEAQASLFTIRPSLHHPLHPHVF